MKRYPKNCEGDFFVEDGECILCTLPVSEAPALMECDDLSCYFKKQPKTDEEIGDAISAIAVSCCGAVKYCGTDKEVIKRMLDDPYIESNAIVKLTLFDKIRSKLGF